MKKIPEHFFFNLPRQSKQIKLRELIYVHLRNVGAYLLRREKWNHSDEQFVILMFSCPQPVRRHYG